jgi:hypothetical protein
MVYGARFGLGTRQGVGAKTMRRMSHALLLGCPTWPFYRIGEINNAKNLFAAALAAPKQGIDIKLLWKNPSKVK